MAKITPFVVHTSEIPSIFDNLPSQDGRAFASWLLEKRPRQAPAFLEKLARHWAESSRHGDQGHWDAALEQLKTLPMPTCWSLGERSIEFSRGMLINAADAVAIKAALAVFKPWRKGPWSYQGVEIDTEWRSDLKWQRFASHVDFNHKTVLDVGCGSGYHLFRARAAGAAAVLGIDPTWLFVYQFSVFKRCVPDVPLWLLPLAMEQMTLAESFDVVLSMGVLYHRRDPIVHLQQLKHVLAPEGELILETLVVEGDAQTVLTPSGRYAAMPNVWFIPSVSALQLWLEKLKFRDVEVLDIGYTSTEEQRKTDWIESASLVDFLDSEDLTKTREGYPAPLRAVIRARR